MMIIHSGFLAPFVSAGVVAAAPSHGLMPDSVVSEIKDIAGELSPALSVVVSVLGACAGARLFMNLFMTPEQKLKRKRRKLVSRIHHPSRSKFKGAARCFRQRFDCRRLRWA